MLTAASSVAASASGYADRHLHLSPARTGAASREHPRRSAADAIPSAEQSRAEVQRVLRSYGARHVSSLRDGTNGRITVRFVMPEGPTAGAPKMVVRLPIDLRRVSVSLFGSSCAGARGEDGQAADRGARRCGESRSDSEDLERAERAAWHHLLQWLAATVAAAGAGLQTVAEAFFAHRVVAFNDGGHGRLVDYLESEQSHLGSSVRALLATPIEEPDI